MTVTQHIDEDSNENDEPIDMSALLELARGVAFEDVANIVQDKEEFEKIDSFFDLVKQGGTDQVDHSDDTLIEDSKDDVLHNDEFDASEQESELELLEEQPLSSDLHEEDDFLATSERATGSDYLNDQSSSHLSNDNASGVHTSDLDEVTDVTEADVKQKDESFGEAPFIPEPISAREMPDDADDERNQKLEATDEHLKVEFERGYSTALKELEGSVDEEKANLRNLANTLFMIQEDIAEVVEGFLIERVKSVSESFIGEIIEDFPEKLLEKIKRESKEFEKFNRNIQIELNELDALAIEKSAGMPDTIKILPNEELKRGEYRLSGHQSVLSKRFEDN